MMPLFYEAGPNGLWVFLLVTVAMGGGAAWATGNAIATTWRPPWQMLGASVLITCAVRFLHYALFAEPLLVAKAFLFDFAVVATVMALAHRVARARQMVRQYPWAFERVGLLWWRSKRQ